MTAKSIWFYVLVLCCTLACKTEYQNLEYAGEFKLDGRMPVSVSPNGKYVLASDRAANQDNLVIYIYQNKNNGYAPLCEIVALMRYGRLQDSDIAWSHDNESFAFGRAAGVQESRNSDIFVINISKRSCVNFTGIAGEDTARFSRDDTLYLDYLPSWSDDDRTIYFARYGNKTGVEYRIIEICFVPSSGGNVSTVRKFLPQESDHGLLQVWQGLFSRGKTLYYDTSASNYLNSKQGIWKYEGGTETFLVHVQSSGQSTILKDVSKDGKRFLYILREYSNQTYLNDRFFYAPTNASGNAVELKAYSSGADSKIINALFSPDGNTILQIERSDNGNYIYFVDASNPENAPRLAYNMSQPSDIFGALPRSGNFDMLQPRWMSNGYLAVNNDTPILLKVNTK
jgi:hypothetical protein